LRKSLGLLEPLAADSKDRHARQDIADVHGDLGRVLERSGDWPGARAHYREQMVRYEALAADFPADSEIRRNLSRAYKSNGVGLARDGEINEAFALLQKALTMDEASFAEDLTPRSKEDLSFAHSDLGLTYSRAGNLRAALKHYRNAFILRLQLTAADPQNLRLRRFLALTYSSLAQVFANSGSFVRSIETYRRATAILEPLSTLDPRNVVVRRDLAQTYSDLASVVLRQAKKERLFDHRVRQWRSATQCYMRSQSEWHVLNSAGTLFGSDADKPAQVDRARRQCEMVLLQMQKK
jgi:tetratricopeptide (TPR) repeat protein